MKREGNNAYLVDLGQRLHVGPVQDPKRKADHLQILAPRGGGNVPRLRPHVEEDVSLQPGHEEVRALVDDGLLDTRHAVEDDGAVAAAHVEHGLLEERHAQGRRHRHPVREVESLRHRSGL